MTRVSVVLVHWNRPDQLDATIDAFRSSDVEVPVIVVDNGSEPAARQRLRQVVAGHEDVRLLLQPENIGFGPGANAGLRHWLATATREEWVLLAPHDAHPLGDCLEVLLDAVGEEPMAGLACADVGDGQVPYLDPYFGGITLPCPEGVGWIDADYPHGTLMALRRDCLEDIGLFDPDYFAYCEEAELGWRAAQAGWRCGLIRGARVQNTHLGTSVAAVDYLQQRNTLRLVRTMSGRYHVFIRIMLSLWHILVGVLRPERAPLVFDARARVVGILDFLRGRVGRPPEWLYERDRRAAGSDS